MTADKRIKEEDRMQCTCGRDVSKRWHFCPECGKPIQSNEAGDMNFSIKKVVSLPHCGQ